MKVFVFISSFQVARVYAAGRIRLTRSATQLATPPKAPMKLADDAQRGHSHVRLRRPSPNTSAAVHPG